MKVEVDRKIFLALPLRPLMSFVWGNGKLFILYQIDSYNLRNYYLFIFIMLKIITMVESDQN